jgi:hypothetical protein
MIICIPSYVDETSSFTRNKILMSVRALICLICVAKMALDGSLPCLQKLVFGYFLRQMNHVHTFRPFRPRFLLILSQERVHKDLPLDPILDQDIPGWIFNTFLTETCHMALAQVCTVQFTLQQPSSSCFNGVDSLACSHSEII